MRLSVRSDVRDVLRDLNYVGREMAPRVSASSLNQIASRKIESPATRETATAADLPVGVVRWHHTAQGTRTSKRRIVRTVATEELQFVDWRWSTKNGEPGAVAFISLPGRRQTRRGFSSPNKKVPSGFITRTKRGQVGAFVREQGAGRYPIRFLRRSIKGDADRSFERELARSGSAFRDEFERRMRVALEKRRARK